MRRGLPGGQAGGGSILGADDGSRSCHGNHGRPDCRSVLSTAHITGLSAAHITDLSAADLAGIPAADLAGLPAADLAGLSAANLAGLSGADLAGLPAANLAGLPGANLAGLSAADCAGLPAAGGRPVASHSSSADGHVHAADHAVGRSRGSDGTGLRHDVDARHAACGSDRALAAAVLPVPSGVRGRGGCFNAAWWMVVAGFRDGAGDCRGT
jgi:hypothetical protein